MALKKRNDCVGCETCCGCGKNFTYETYHCDICGDPIGEGSFDGYLYNGSEFCSSCLIDELVKKNFFPNDKPDERKIKDFFCDADWLDEYGEFNVSMFGDVDPDDIASFCQEHIEFIKE